MQGAGGVGLAWEPRFVVDFLARSLREVLQILLETYLMISRPPKAATR